MLYFIESVINTLSGLSACEKLMQSYMEQFVGLVIDDAQKDALVKDLQNQLDNILASNKRLKPVKISSWSPDYDTFVKIYAGEAWIELRYVRDMPEWMKETLNGKGSAKP